MKRAENETNARQRTMLTVNEVADRWGMHRETIYKAVDTGELKAVRCGRSIRISRSYVEGLERDGNIPMQSRKAG